MEWIYVSPLNNPEGIIEGGDISLSGYFSPPKVEREITREREMPMKTILVTEATAKAILALAESLAVPSEQPVAEPSAPVLEPSAPVVPALIPSGSAFAPVPSGPVVASPKPVPTPTELANKKAAKAAKREFNQRLNSQINGLLGAATTAVSSGDTVGAAKALTNAMELVPSHWGGTLDRVVAKAQSLGFAKVA